MRRTPSLWSHSLHFPENMRVSFRDRAGNVAFPADFDAMRTAAQGAAVHSDQPTGLVRACLVLFPSARTYRPLLKTAHLRMGQGARDVRASGNIPIKLVFSAETTCDVERATPRPRAGKCTRPARMMPGAPTVGKRNRREKGHGCRGHHAFAFRRPYMTAIPSRWRWARLPTRAPPLPDQPISTALSISTRARFGIKAHAE
jgi:hypothetical protein